MALPEYKSQKTKVWQYLNQPLSVLKSALGITNGGGGGDFLTATVTVTAAEFIAATVSGDVVKTLLPSPGAGKFLLVNSMIIKFKDATVAFDSAPRYAIISSGNLVTFILGPFGTTPNIVRYTNDIIGKVDESIYVELQSGTAPTTGDGNLIFEIEYQILDF